jgi:hypothetical protein
MRIIRAIAALVSMTALGAVQNTQNPAVAKIVAEVSSERIAATLKRLESFGSRNTLSSQTDAERGIGAARTWIVKELKDYSPRLQVSLDTHRVKKQGRITRDVEMSNIVAVLPGTIHPDDQVLVTGHYDSLVLAAPLTEEQRRAGEQPKSIDPDLPAPGVNDDGSGTAAVMELARVMSQREFDKTLVFILFVAEEQGLIGSSLYARKAHDEKESIEAVLNNDIIGSEVAGNGLADGVSVRVFSEDPIDSRSRQVARYIKDIGERYVPEMRIELVFRADRFGRGGDHTPFNQEGFPAVRISSAEENLANQHTKTDTFANMSVPYNTRVAKINAAVAATLAWSPRAPVILEPIERGERKGQLVPMIGRGKSRYDALLRWKNPSPEADFAGYVVLMRGTTEPLWTKSFLVNKDAKEFLLSGVSIDEYVFGVQAIDADGNPSLASVYTITTREKAKIETY